MSEEWYFKRDDSIGRLERIRAPPSMLLLGTYTHSQSSLKA